MTLDAKEIAARIEGHKGLHPMATSDVVEHLVREVLHLADGHQRANADGRWDTWEMTAPGSFTIPDDGTPGEGDKQ